MNPSEKKFPGKIFFRVNEIAVERRGEGRERQAETNTIRFRFYSESVCNYTRVDPVTPSPKRVESLQVLVLDITPRVGTTTRDGTHACDPIPPGVRCRRFNKF